MAGICRTDGRPLFVPAQGIRKSLTMAVGAYSVVGLHSSGMVYPPCRGTNDKESLSGLDSGLRLALRRIPNTRSALGFGGSR